MRLLSCEERSLHTLRGNSLDGSAEFLYILLYCIGACVIGRNAKFLLTLTNNKWSPGVDPGDHHFVD